MPCPWILRKEWVEPDNPQYGNARVEPKPIRPQIVFSYTWTKPASNTLLWVDAQTRGS